MTVTARLGLDIPQPSENISAYPAEAAQSLGVLDSAVIVSEGTLAARPAASSVAFGTDYYATDTLQWFRSNGTSWGTLLVQPATAYGKAIITTGQTLTVSSYQTIQLASVQFGTWNAATYSFTAPVTGVYQCNGAMSVNVDPPVVQLTFAKNGATGVSITTGFNAGEIGPLPVVDLLQCNQGDTLSLVANPASTVVVNGASMSVVRVG